MSSTTQVETVTSSADKAKLAAAGALVIAGVAAFYLLGKQDLWLRIVALLALIAAGVGVFFTSGQGKELIAFGQDSWKELQKVVWPTKQEARQMTLYVFAFVVVMALFLWLVDKSLEWLLYSVILGWKA
ncbi:MAG: hypothetical protein RLZZ182_428 [Pseudomonadota bacterium]|jgi:preprotein translocase subunit SecE